MQCFLCFSAACSKLQRMPIFEYECLGCGNQFEYLVLPSSPKAECPSCKRKKLKQLISLCAVSSEGTRQANLSQARKKASVVQKDKRHEEHKQMHEHHD
jgi:putative FmdB family regulatory protein